MLRDDPILTFTNDASAPALPGVVSELKDGEGVKAKADALGASKLMIIGETGVMPDASRGCAQHKAVV
ncbi:hypothetical protein CEP82_002340 [Mobiluncus mulieris]|nr:hypothetical protein [Mobiluncus mulieris]PNL42741.1 hypothetical protein CEP82_002340 [Mobiluncus mulieris]